MNEFLVGLIVEAGSLGVLVYIIWTHQKERSKSQEGREVFNKQLFEYMEVKNNTTRKVADDFSKSMENHNRIANERHTETIKILSQIQGRASK